MVLTAILQVTCEWTGNKAVSIYLMRYGRKVRDSLTDLSFAIGWHAVPVPVGVDDRLSGNISDSIRELHQSLEQIPFSGAHFNILKYLCDDQDIQSGLSYKPMLEIMLNYYPKDLNVVDGEVAIDPFEAPLGPCVAPENYTDTASLYR